MCWFLLIFPVFMAFKISQFFHMDFWLLILVSSCILTSLQVTGTLLIYCLFMVEVWRGSALPALDEIVYYVNGVCRVLEFVVAVCVVAYGAWESLWGEWSWLGASVIIIHSYCNVWLRAQAGWKSFLLRQEAARKINLLPRASAEQLQEHNDVCAICFQDMTSAVVTYCGHIYHGTCLRKWLYVQETCPMCHASIKPSLANQMAAAGDAQPQQDQQQQQPTDPQPHPSEHPPRPEHSHQEEAQGSRGDGVHVTHRTCDEFKTNFSNSQSSCSKDGPQNLHCGANGDSQGVGEQRPSLEKRKDVVDETQEHREAH